MTAAVIEPIRRWTRAHAHLVLFDEASGTLVDMFSGKALRLDVARAAQVVERRTSDTGEAYVVIVLDDGRQIALAPAGVAFAPDARNVGALPLPPVVCWRDFAAVMGQVEHVLGAHPDEPPGRELLDMVLYSIALVDGARAIGFEVGPEERRLERALDEIERRRGAG